MFKARTSGIQIQGFALFCGPHKCMAIIQTSLNPRNAPSFKSLNGVQKTEPPHSSQNVNLHETATKPPIAHFQCTMAQNKQQPSNRGVRQQGRQIKVRPAPSRHAANPSVPEAALGPVGHPSCKLQLSWVALSFRSRCLRYARTFSWTCSAHSCSFPRQTSLAPPTSWGFL